MDNEELIGYDGLAVAVVAQAIEDYRELTQKVNTYKTNMKFATTKSEMTALRKGLAHASKKLAEVQAFFNSDWYKQLCSIPAEDLLKGV